jgi:hypothetical protein
MTLQCADGWEEEDVAARKAAAELAYTEDPEGQVSPTATE